MEKQIAAINQIGNEMSRFATAVEQLAETNRAMFEYLIKKN